MDLKYVVLFENGFYYNDEREAKGSMEYSLSKSKLYSTPYHIERDETLKKYCDKKNIKYTIEMVKLKIIK